MNFIKIALSFILLIFIYSCADFNQINSTNKPERKYYSSMGFALIYEDSLYDEKVLNSKINNDNLHVIHSTLRKNTPIQIINPLNSNVIETKVYKKSNVPNIFNIVISKKIATVLELDFENPYVEVLELKKNKTFIAKEANIFDEEKKVASTAPVDSVQMDDLSINDTTPKKSNKKNNYILVISDFYYLDSANNLKNELINKTKINKFSVKKINDRKYRLFVGPFKNFNALKSTYISLNNLGFEGLNIYKD